MKIKFDNTIMAFLLAFQGLDTSLTQQEKQNLKEVAKQLDSQPKAWKSHIEQHLLEIIAANSELNQAYQFYKHQLDNIEEISNDLLPTEAEISRLTSSNRASILKGFRPKSEAIDYETQINNVAIIVGSSEQPEETVKQITFLDKWKQFLSKSHSLN
ncbi:MAG TPA: hypothetical protein VK203_13625 [Nostocaceae cyanobacterium]|nr:hypothetical protein [Nostocaceae cyanobacterium]